MKSFGAEIVTLEEFKLIRPKLKGTIVMTSGGFDPIHPGHISCFEESKKLGDILVVALNGDSFLAAKKGKPFQDAETRALILCGIRYVDYVIPFDISGDITAAQPLEAVRPQIFTKGGNRGDFKHIPREEQEVCKLYNIEVKFGIGMDKKWSSSTFLNDWVLFCTKDQTAKDRVDAFYEWSYGGEKKK